MSPPPEFSSEIVAILSVTAGGRRLKTVLPTVKIHAATKKRVLSFGRTRAKSLVDIFRQMG